MTSHRAVFPKHNPWEPCDPPANDGEISKFQEQLLHNTSVMARWLGRIARTLEKIQRDHEPHHAVALGMTFSRPMHEESK